MQYVALGVNIGSVTHNVIRGETVATVRGIRIIPLLVAFAKDVYLLSLGLVFADDADMQILRCGDDLYGKIGSRIFRLKPLDIGSAMLIHANSIADEVGKAVGDGIVPEVFRKSREVAESFIATLRARLATRGQLAMHGAVRTSIHATRGSITVGAVYYDLGVDRWWYYRLNNLYTTKPEALEAIARVYRVREEEVDSTLEMVVEFLKRFPNLMAASYLAVELSKRLE